MSKKEIWLPIGTLIVVGGFIYSFNLNNQLFWDDDDWIINNSFVHQISWDNVKFWLTNDALAGVGLQSNYYRPFLFFTFALNYIISGVKPLGYHLFSNLIHIANGVLVFLLLKRFDLGISKGSRSGNPTPWELCRTLAVAFLTALIFTIHPLQTEAITYISGRGDALVAMFMLLGLLFFYKSQQNHTTRYFLFTTFFLVLGLLSRETGIIFPVLALSLYVSVISKERFLRSVRQGLKKTWPYFAVVFIYGILRLTVLNFLDTLNFYTAPNLYSENLSYRLLTFMHVLVDYFKLLFVPTGLHMERSMAVHTSLFQWPVWLGALILFSILVALYRLYKNRYPDFKIWLFGWGWFFIALGPVSGVTPINALMYEHWLYLPMVGFWLIISFYLVKLFDFFKLKSLTTYYLLLTTLIIYLSFFSYQSIQRNILWGNSLAFYLDILKYEPNSVRINNNVGNTYYNRKDMENAERYYRIAVSGEDIFAEPHFNLGGILQSRGDIYGAIKEFEKAIEINPNFFYPYQNLAVIYAQQGNLSKAAENIEKLKLLLPNNPRVYYNSALVYIAINDKKKALEDVNTGLKHSRLDPEVGKLLEELAGKLSN